MQRPKLFAKISYFLGLIAIISIGGTAGFMIIEDWGVVDAFYMTIITISTVGFGEVNPLSMYGKLFTAFLVISSFSTFAYAITNVTRYLVGGEYKRYLKAYRVMKEIKKMNNHVIICGFGRVGMQVAADLSASKQDFVILEQNDVVISDGEELFDYIFLKGDSTNDEFLQRAGISNAKAIITCLPKDADNTFVVLSAREYNEHIAIISRASQKSSLSKLKMAGATNVIMPDSIGGTHMASLVTNPDVMEFFANIQTQANDQLNVGSLSFEDLPGAIQNASLRDFKSSLKANVQVIGFKNELGNYDINPSDDTKITSGSKLFILGDAGQITALKTQFNLKR